MFWVQGRRLRELESLRAEVAGRDPRLPQEALMPFEETSEHYC